MCIEPEDAELAGTTEGSDGAERHAMVSAEREREIAVPEDGRDATIQIGRHGDDGL
jgi:hypothetical protein